MRKILFAGLLAIAVNAHAMDRTDLLLSRAWPYAPFAKIHELGSGVAVVFSPDLSVKNNCRFYQALGFACFEDTDWTRILDGIHKYNDGHPGERIHTLILETHGTNGNGLKVQQSYKPNAERSYISVGALQERLEPEGLRYIIVSACNSGRLLRPAIVRNLDPDPGDKLFLPATCGIVGASYDFNPRRSRITVITPAASHIETTLVGTLGEFKPVTRRAITEAAKAKGIKLPPKFAISEMMIQMMLRDPRLELQAGEHVDALSKDMSSVDHSESLFRSLKTYLNDLAARGTRVVTADKSRHSSESRVR